jgi:hypothetical protein
MGFKGLAFLFITSGLTLSMLSGCSALQQRAISSPPECEVQDITKIHLWQKLPVILHFDRSFPVEARPAVERAITSWNEATLIDLFEISPEDSPTLASPIEKTNIIYWEEAEGTTAHFKETDLAYTDTSFFEGEPYFIKIEIGFNSNHYVFEVEHRRNEFAYDLESIMVHELGHALGLDHYAYGIMSPATVPGRLDRKITPEATRALKCLYGRYSLQSREP